MMQPWFPDAKLGIFIHYGIYAVKGVSESWSFYNGQVPHADYMAQLDGFTASKYDADSWCELFEKAGAKYAVLTTKHHDGVALWDTKANDLSTVKATPAKKDLITPFAEACRKHNLKVGFYYSHLDWNHPDYATVLPKSATLPDADPKNWANRFGYPERGHEDPARWANFLKFHRAQLKELCTEFGQVDLLWFDGDWERDPEQFQMKELRDELHAMQPNVILNSRMLGYGDYATPEQGQPVTAPEGVWEFCVTINDSWGYQVQDHNHKSVRQIVRICAECFGTGGNVLLDVGPYEDGSLQPEQINRLEGLGRWMKKHAEGIYGTQAGLPAGLHYGPSTLSKDKKSLFLFMFDKPQDEVFVKGIRSKVVSASVVGTGESLPFVQATTHDWTGVPTPVVIDASKATADQDCTVIKLEFADELVTWLGAGRS